MFWKFMDDCNGYDEKSRKASSRLSSIQYPGYRFACMVHHVVILFHQSYSLQKKTNYVPDIENLYPAIDQ